jgi:hypothetical protein
MSGPSDFWNRCIHPRPQDKAFCCIFVKGGEGGWCIILQSVILFLELKSGEV